MKRQSSIRALEHKRRFTINDLSNYALPEGIPVHHNSRGINVLLPEEILFHHIFLRLSPKTLLCCRSVCKTWNRLIRDPRFVRHHLNRQHHKHKFLAMTSNERIYSVDYEGEGGVWFNLPAQAHSQRPQVFGSSNGLLALCIYHQIHPAAYNLILWNPITRESKLIPDPDPYIRAHAGETLGFCYDSSMDDYKFIRVIKTARMDVYSLRSNSWNMVKLDDSQLKKFKSDITWYGVGVNGYLYWRIDDHDADADADNGKYLSQIRFFGLCVRHYHTTETRLPHGTTLIWGFGAIGSCLGVHSYERQGNFVLWTLKENDERKWEKLMTLSLSLSFPEDNCFWAFIPVSVTKDGKLVIFFNEGYDDVKRHNKLGLYDLQKKSFKYVPITGDDNSIFVTRLAHVQSLVSPNMF